MIDELLLELNDYKLPKETLERNLTKREICEGDADICKAVGTESYLGRQR